MVTGCSCTTRARACWQPAHLSGKASASSPFLAWIRDTNTCWRWCPWRGPTQPLRGTSATGRVSSGGCRAARGTVCRGGRDGVGDVVWKLQQRDHALGVMQESRQYAALGYPTTPTAFLPGTQKIPGMGNMGKLGFFFLIIIFRNVEMADKHNKSFHVLVPTVPALCLGDPEVSAPTLSQPCRVLGVMCRALQAGR